MPIDATVGGADANSYVTLAEADQYFTERLHTAAWDDLSDPDKEATLLWAARIIESKISAYWDKKQLPEDATIRILSDLKGESEATVVWTGSPANEDQALAWPRAGMKNQNGFDLDDDVIPKRIKDFQCEVALKLIAEDRTEENAATAQGLTRLKAGPVELGWKNGAPNPKLIPDGIMQVLVKSWWFAFELKYQINARGRLI